MLFSKTTARYPSDCAAAVDRRRWRAGGQQRMRSSYTGLPPEAIEPRVAIRATLEQARHNLGCEHAVDCAVAAKSHNGEATGHVGHGIDERQSVVTFPERTRPFMRRFHF